MTKFTKKQIQEIKLLRQKLTNDELYQHLSENFDLKLGFTTFRTELYKAKLFKCKMLRWTKAEKQFLLDNYLTKGNKEIAEKLSKPGRIFTIKNVNKEMNLLKIKRTPEALKFIKDNHRKNGVYKNSTARIKEQGTRYYPEGHIKIGIDKGVPMVKIKVNGLFTPYARYRYSQLHGEIPKGHKVYFKDCNFRNISDDNLVLKKATGNTNAERKLYQKYYDEYFAEQSQNNPKVIKLEKPSVPAEPKKNLICVKIGKTILKVKPGTNINELRAKYENRKFI